MVEIGERDDQADVVLVDEPAQRGDVAGVVDPRHERMVVGVVERGRERVEVGRDGRRAGAPERRDDVDALPRAGEEDRSHRPRLALPAAGLALVGAAEERERRAQQDQQVGEPRAVLDVPDVQLDPLVPGERGAAVDLRPARDPRQDVEPLALALGVLLDLIAERRAAGRSRSCPRARRSRAAAARRATCGAESRRRA